MYGDKNKLTKQKEDGTLYVDVSNKVDTNLDMDELVNKVDLVNENMPKTLSHHHIHTFNNTELEGYNSYTDYIVVDKPCYITDVDFTCSTKHGVLDLLIFDGNGDSQRYGLTRAYETAGNTDFEVDWFQRSGGKNRYFEIAKYDENNDVYKVINRSDIPCPNGFRVRLRNKISDGKHNYSLQMWVAEYS